MTQNEIRNILSKACAKVDSQKAWAKLNGFSPTYISDVVLGRREVSDKVAKALGYERVISYRKANKNAK